MKSKNNKFKKSKAIFIGILGLLLLTPIFLYYNFTSNTLKSNDPKKTDFDEDNNPKRAGSGVITPLHITGANWSNLVGKPWFAGDGSSTNPYRIENVTIDATDYLFGIYIENSIMDYFEIRNCTIINPYLFGINGYIINNGTFDNNTIYSDNTCYLWGINADYGSNLIISNNTIKYIEGIGINLYGFNDFKLKGNTVRNTKIDGIYINTCNNFTLTENTVRNNERDGISLCDCNNFTLTDNTVRNNGLDGIYYETEAISNINGNNITLNKIYDNNADGISLNFDCDNQNVNVENNSILNNVIYGNGDDGIQIEFYVNDSEVLYENNNVSNNEIHDNGGNGVIISCDEAIIGTSIFQFIHNNISDNLVYENGHYEKDDIEGVGIYIDFEIADDSILILKHNLIIRNNISDTFWEGIYLEMCLTEDSLPSALIECGFNNISENRLESIGFDGISLLGEPESNSEGKIYIYNNTIANNTINDMLSDGIALWFFEEDENNVEIYIENNTIINNKITRITKVKDFAQAGIYIDNSLKTKISNNKMNNCGLLIAPEHPDVNKLLSYEIINNKVNGKALICRTSEEDIDSIDFNDAGQIVLINCNYTTILNLNVSKATIGICLYYCKNITIFNVTSSNGAGGFLLSYSNKNNISTNIANDNTLLGIYLYKSNYTRIENNNFLRNPYCIIEQDCIGNIKINNKCPPPIGGLPPSGDDDDDDDGVKPPIHGYNFLILLLVNFIMIFALSITLLRKKIRKL